MNSKKKKSEAGLTLYKIFLVLTFPIWILFYVAKYSK